jgi:O-antigen/teichoic acid export membrane protein
VIFVGYYAPAYAIGGILTFFIYPFAVLLPPFLSKLFDERKIEEVKRYLEYSLKYFLLIAIPLSFGLSIFSYQLLEVFTTKEIALNSYFVTPFAVLSILLYGLYTIFVQILVLFKKTKTFATIWFGAAILNILLNIIFIPAFGIIAAATTTLVAYILGFYLTWRIAFKNMKFNIDWRFILKSILSSLAMIFAVGWFSPDGFLQLALVGVLGAIVYALLIILLKGIKKEEFMSLKFLLS